MKTQIKTTPVEAGGLVTQGEFKIKQSAKAFSVLSSGLYSNKHQAILRELGCNAYDSHVEAGKADVPFKVHLPSKLNPVFYVEDYGIGLDHDGVVNIYTTYFESTKQDSNDYVGCLGLGSKSPFSYTDNFTVIARKDGVERTYTAFINEEGVPAIALLAEHPTEECNGVRVQFAVSDQQDMYRFREEAAKVYKWFKVRPEITGQDCTIPEIKYAETDIVPGVHVRDTSNVNNYYDRRRSYAIMGNIAYPINLEEVEDKTDRRNDIREMFDNGCLIVEFDIGELDIAASREELSYIPHTLDSIYRKGEEISKHLGEFIEKEMTGVRTKWKRTEVLNRLYNSNKTLFSPAIKDYMKRNPRKFFKYTRLDYYGCRTYFALEDFRAISEDLQVSYYDISKRYSDNAMVASRYRAEHIREDQEDNDSDIVAVYELFGDNVTIVMQDDKGSPLPRIKEGVLNKQIKAKRVMVFRVTNKDADKDAIYKKVKRMLGNPTIVWTSTLPKTSTASIKNKNLSVFRVNESYGRYHSRKYSWKLESDVSKLEHAIPKGKKHVYVPLQHKSVDFGDFTMSPDEFFRWLKNEGIPAFVRVNEKKIYGINKTTRKLIKDDKKWVNFFDLYRQEFDKIDWAKAKEDARRKYIRSVVNDGDYDFTKLDQSKLLDLSKQDSPFGKLAKFYADNRNTKAASDIRYDRLIVAMRKMGGDEKKMEKLEKNLQVDKVEDDVKAIFGEVEQTYPMLKHLNLRSTWGASNDWNDAHDYIKLVDSTL